MTLLSACQIGAAAPVPKARGNPPAGVCDRAAADALAGRARVTDEEARRLTGASVVRQIEPGMGVTMDYRQERVTIETDPKTGKIFRAYCG
ncbi:MAG: hypothetical protein J0H09_28475 [Burkholderiales bacterium]|nr:hypothetical protein [Burkholderiales bacterium]